MDERSSAPSTAAAPTGIPPAARDAALPRPAPPAPRKDESSVKETIESILVAFILAFIFRAFIVEAFVIPTGSMAPTLLGAHLRWSCNDCGYRFDTNYRAENDADGNPIIPARSGPYVDRGPDEQPRLRNMVHDVACPNCGFEVPADQAKNVPVHYGDRILVLKYLYLFEDPQRWDVVVFKSPFDSPKYQQNYIKRLVGRPSESIVLLDGDVYVAPAGAGALDDFQIQTKPRHVQDALWRVIYDNDHHPQGLRRGARPWRQPWTVKDGAGWELESGMSGAEPRMFTFDNADAGGTIAFDRDANPTNHAFTDWLAYDIEEERRWNAAVVGDLKVKLDYHRTGGDGPLRVRLTKAEDAFVAELTPSAVRLLRSTRGGPEIELAAAAVSLGGSRPVRVEFENVDHQVTLRVNGEAVLQTTPDQYFPDKQALLRLFREAKQPAPPSVEIAAERQACTLSHVSLWRDVYYLNRDKRHMTSTPAWASPVNFPENVIHLGPKEYFVLGDNSLMSLDARMWNEPIELADLSVESGRVPDRFMLGKAFFVYWPAGYKPVNIENVPAITPNFGDMRFIR